MIQPARTDKERELLVAYIASKIGTSPRDLVSTMPFEVVATTGKNGDATGAVLYINYRGTSIEMACAGEPGWLTRQNLRGLFAYPFNQLGCYTVLSMVKRRNKVARAFNEKIGFVTLGVIECGGPSGEDTIINSMTRPQCRWLSAEAEAAPMQITKARFIGEHAHG